METETFFNSVQALPKVDLHRHLEGSVSAETFISVARDFGGNLPVYEVEALRDQVQVNTGPYDFRYFLSRFKIFREFYESPDAIRAVAYAAVKAAALDNVKYLELRFSPTHFAVRKKFAESDVIRWIQSSIEAAARDFQMIVVPVLTISRDFPPALAQQTLDLALSLRDRFFCGLDIAGDERLSPAGPFQPIFNRAKKAGMGLTVHAGEAGGPENVKEAILDLSADRIGHGIRAIEDRNVVDLLIHRNVLLEVCITSNIHTGVVENVSEHPVKIIREMGIPFCLGTDDPAMSSLTLSDEYCTAIKRLGFSIDDLQRMNLEAISHAFYPDKNSLKIKFTSCRDNCYSGINP